ncbi:MAG: short-chain dehydrogenase/reductase [Deltaproteobacteria bacterium]|jgi:NAD(P)-dependent dehydrogenase (short-subunit alcohol dehydrogenase family)|nr:short-chain dehydrogenase/reductase [Deltaproteobacteria bacterium]
MTSTHQKKLINNVALITGATRGIGKAVAAAYVREGARVFICARNQQEVAVTVREFRYDSTDAQVDGCAGDVGKENDVCRIVDAVIERFQKIDTLVNNASLLGPRVALVEYPFRQWEEVIRVNLHGVFLLSQEVVKRMIVQRHGSIINVSSGVGRVGRARWGAYAVSKFGLEGLTQVLADEVKEFGIRVNSVNPGPTRTEMRAEAYPEEDPLTLPTPEQITPIFVHLASAQSENLTGQMLEAQDWSEPIN